MIAITMSIDVVIFAVAIVVPHLTPFIQQKEGDAEYEFKRNWGDISIFELNSGLFKRS